ncbi:hypothetical protein AB0I53_33850 [Saccharopolyspora sp. NPDC050389]|uniref:hypothetical protein n=1 Tax=Saccharopolyspora sp. NPDC050389 TaxID=3155516 RepID=UPI0033DE6D3C
MLSPVARADRAGRTSSWPGSAVGESFEVGLVRGLDRRTLPRPGANLVDYLRTNGLVVVYFGPDWTLEEVSSTRQQEPLQY